MIGKRRSVDRLGEKLNTRFLRNNVLVFRVCQVQGTWHTVVAMCAERWVTLSIFQGHRGQTI